MVLDIQGTWSLGLQRNLPRGEDNLILGYVRIGRVPCHTEKSCIVGHSTGNFIRELFCVIEFSIDGSVVLQSRRRTN
jgi:hypothetical protein